jgi:hypothetical protein
MKVFPLLTCLSLALAVLLFPGVSRASHPKAKQQQDDPKYKYDEASTLSGIDLKPDKKSKTFTLQFDQRLYETGILEIKNTANKVLFTRVLAANSEPLTRTYQVGALKPGLYSIEVKTADTTFWKKVRIRK